MLLDEADGALGTERADAVLDERRDAGVVALDEHSHLRLGPGVDLAAQPGVGNQRQPRAIEPVAQPRRELRAGIGQVGAQRVGERGRGVVEHHRQRRRGEQLARGGVDPRGQRGIGRQPALEVGEDLDALPPQRVLAVLGDLAQPGMQRRHQPVAIEHAEQRRHAHQQPWIDAEPLPVAREEVVHDVADGLAELRPLHRAGQHRQRAVEQPLVPALPPRHAQRGRQQRRHRLGRQRAPAAREQLRRGGRRQLLGGPAGEHAGGALEIRARETLGAAGDQVGQIDPRDLVAHVLLRQDAPADHHADALGHQLPVARDEAGVRDRQAEGPAKDRRHCEPVGQPADDAGLGDGQDPAAPPGRPHRNGGHRQPGRAEQDAEREPALALHERSAPSRKSSIRSVARGPGAHVCVARGSPPLHAWPMPGTSHDSSTAAPRASR